MEDRRCIQFIGVELAGSAEIVAPVEKAVKGHSGGERGPGEGLPVAAPGTSRRQKGTEATGRARC
jgi:hypothetical protein